jgi:indolepyruvate ferredoxin oxidoreductase
VAKAERARGNGGEELTEAVARNLSKLMSYKDEYEVARLYADGRFADSVKRRFDDAARIEIHLAPPLFARRDPATGRPMKRAYGPWILPVLSLLAHMKRLRGTRWDPFSRIKERRMERKLLADYQSTIEEIMDSLTPDNHALAVELASLPGHIRGFGHVKEKSVLTAKAHERNLLDRFRSRAQDRDIVPPQTVPA